MLTVPAAGRGSHSALEDWLRDEPLEPNEMAVVLGQGIANHGFDQVEHHKRLDYLPAGARLPADTVRLVGEVSLSDGERRIMHMRLRRESEWGLAAGKESAVSAYVYFPSESKYTWIGSFSYESNHCMTPKHQNKDDELLCAQTTLIAAYMLDLINTPAFVTKDTLPRATRRRIDRNSGTNASDRIRVVSWNLTKPKLEAGETAGCGRHMPLHYTRGHWRQCAAHLDRAHLHDDGVHRMWIEGFWSGHPAYGIVRSIHAPKL